MAGIDKRVASADEAIADVGDGAVILMGGFGVCGLPENLIRALRDKGVKNLTLASNNAGLDDQGVGLLLNNGQVKKMILSYGGECKAFEEMTLGGTLEVEWTPQGTLAERIRAAGAGIGGFFTPTGYGTVVAEGKETREIDGNLVFRRTARNFNQVMSTAAKTVIAEAEEIVETGGLHPDQIHTPGAFVSRVLKGEAYKKPIEKRTVRAKSEAAL
ncbi:MAG: succinyl-CoA--3-ketoacid-CoA transferase [Elusimicrobia bacterium CG22_combo_CG10-13_8_21_14_all_63_91]|nr:MAG: succinyl-CoA--3-ketoacid-CoA transferase [Elusimicrobia bacterium CG22_combo_CG10-13_8_21_14_all_63_91]